MATVLLDIAEGRATLTLNRPDKLNALNDEMFEELAAHVETVRQATDRVGVVVLKGAGRAFSAGVDLGSFGGGGGPIKSRSQTVDAIANLPQPVVASVQGACMTGGLELALSADIIVAGTSAKFADTHAKWGLTPYWGMTQRLPRRIGRSKALEMSFSARFYSGEEAAAMGLANFCVADDALDAEVDRLAADIAANSWHTHLAMKKIIGETEGLPIAAGIAYEFHYQPGKAPDYLERIERFSKRKS